MLAKNIVASLMNASSPTKLTPTSKFARSVGSDWTEKNQTEERSVAVVILDQQSLLLQTPHRQYFPMARHQDNFQLASLKPRFLSRQMRTPLVNMAPLPILLMPLFPILSLPPEEPP